MEVNRVLEIDVDTNRSPFLLLRVVKSTPHREGIVPHETDIKADLMVLTNALLCSILAAEKEGIYKPGECMKKVIENLQEGFIDASAEASKINFDEKGNIEKE